MIDRPGIWCRAGLAGTVTGLAMAEALAGLPAAFDRAFAATLLARAEIAMVSAMAEAMPDPPPKA